MRKPSQKTIGSILVGFLAAILLLGGTVYIWANPGCRNSASTSAVTASTTQTSAKAPAETTRIHHVKVMPVTRDSACMAVTYPGSVKAPQTAALAFRVGGPLIEVRVKPGDTVRKGDVLMRIDPRDYDRQVTATEAALAAAEAQFDAMKKGARLEDIRALEANLDAGKAKREYVKKQHERLGRLVDHKAVSRSQFDNIDAELDAADASVRALEQELIKAKAGSRLEDIRAQEARISGLKTQLQIAKDKLEDTQLLAPFDGIITRQSAENFENIGPGREVLAMHNISQLEIEVDLPEKELMFRPLDKPFEVNLRFENARNRAFRAKFKEVNTEANRATRTYAVTFLMDAPTDVNILPGMTAEVDIRSCDSRTQGKTALFVPAAAVLADKTGATYVWTVGKKSDHVAERRDIKTGTLTEDGRREVLSGLEEGEQVVVSGGGFLHDGMKLCVLTNNTTNTNTK